MQSATNISATSVGVFHRSLVGAMILYPLIFADKESAYLSCFFTILCFIEVVKLKIQSNASNRLYYLSCNTYTIVRAKEPNQMYQYWYHHHHCTHSVAEKGPCARLNADKRIVSTHCR